MNCKSCEMLSINGVACHEIGCPDAWRDRTAECFECGCEFHPESRTQSVCDDCKQDAEHTANCGEFYE